MAVQSLPQQLHAINSSSSHPALSLSSSKQRILFLNFSSFSPKSKRRIITVSNTRGFRTRSLLQPVEWTGANAMPHSSSASSTSKPKVANLKDILSERGSCGVGFIANLDNEASHAVVKDALVALGCMEHRGGCGADNDSGDGSGVMTAIPGDLFNNWANEMGHGSLDKSHTGVGMVFVPNDGTLARDAKADH